MVSALQHTDVFCPSHLGAAVGRGRHDRDFLSRAQHGTSFSNSLLVCGSEDCGRACCSIRGEGGELVDMILVGTSSLSYSEK